MRTDDPEYRAHAVFAAIEGYAKFYEQLSESVMAFLWPGTKAFVNIDTYLYQSMGGTLKSIQVILGEGRINDAYALVRKYFDSVTLSLYVGLYLNDRHDERMTSVDEVKVNQVMNWLRGTKPLPKYEIMKNVVARSERLKPVIGILLTVDNRYRSMRERSNGHMHYNDFQSMLLNDKDARVNRLPVLNLIESDIADLFVLHLACVFFMNEHYMMSSDYMDYLECGMTPEVDSQYWVAPFVQAVFDEVLKARRPDVCAAIKSHTSMHLE